MESNGLAAPDNRPINSNTPVIMARSQPTVYRCTPRPRAGYFAMGFLLASILFNHPVILPYGKPTRNITPAQPKGVDERSLDEDDFFSFDEERPKHSIKSINLIGERHCATKWMTSHLEDCFGDQVEVLSSYTRQKHWFQYADRGTKDSRNYHHPNSSLVVAMFRDPYGA